MKDKFKEKMNDRSYEERLMRNYKKKRENSEQRVNAYSVFLAVVCALVAVVFFFCRELWLGLGFLGIGGLLILMVYLSEKENKKDDKNKKK